MGGDPPVHSVPASLRGIPHLGSGMGYRREIRREMHAAADDLDFVEIITEQYTGSVRAQAELERLCDRFRVIPHGVRLSIGSFTPPAPEYLAAIKRVSDTTAAPYYSEHLAVTRAPGLEFGHLSPVWFTEDALQVVIANVRRVQDYLEKPLILENVTYAFEIPEAEMSQPEFFHRLVEATGCGILLDVHNVHTNSVNHKFDPIAFLESMPLAYVVQVHVAGGFWSGDVLMDGHNAPVPEETWQLLERLVQRAPVKGVLLEHDADFLPFEELLAEVERGRRILQAAAPAGGRVS